MERQPSIPARSGATLVDRAYQLAYKCAYQLMRVQWHLRRPTTHGALVALWSRDEILLVKNSYVSYYSLPGGYVHKDEHASQAALRELEEEVGVVADASKLKLALEVTHTWQGKQDHVCLFDYQAEERPAIAVDFREVVHSAFYSVEAALALDLFPPLRQHIEAQRGKENQ